MNEDENNHILRDLPTTLSYEVQSTILNYEAQLPSSFTELHKKATILKDCLSKSQDHLNSINRE